MLSFLSEGQVETMRQAGLLTPELRRGRSRARRERGGSSHGRNAEVEDRIELDTGKSQQHLHHYLPLRSELLLVSGQIVHPTPVVAFYMSPKDVLDLEMDTKYMTQIHIQIQRGSVHVRAEFPTPYRLQCFFFCHQRAISGNTPVHCLCLYIENKKVVFHIPCYNILFLFHIKNKWPVRLQLHLNQALSTVIGC